ncbi:MAG: cystathionine beta-lyase [Rhodospirillaceae bacterium]|jgi:cysteine-S-conjugate beta-lyase|nr:cystathionine beta-lyase [Rhodospirillaceae bacterium]MBT6138226.1 cystathionine beta-lyase [Rhodospirillaceae bacterium]
MTKISKRGTATTLVHSGRHPRDNHGVINPPVYRASTIAQPNFAAWKESRKPDYKGYRYGLVGTPTTRYFEEALIAIYNAAGAIPVGSGLSAITTALLACLKPGDHLLMTDSAYVPSRNFCEGMLKDLGIETTYYDPRVGAGIADLMRPETKVVFTESPGSMTFEIQDIPAIAGAAHAGGAIVILDNTWASALCLAPFELGVDVVVEAVTKYIAGHSDVIMGAIISGDAASHDLMYKAARQLGQFAAPDDLYLAQRGLRTMEVRMQRNAETSIQMAKWLETRPEVSCVLHPALESHPDHALWKRDFTGAAGLFSFVLQPCSDAALTALLDGLELYGMGASWGGYESLVIPQFPATARSATEWTEPGQLLRIHTGLEDPEDLIADMGAGLDRLRDVQAAGA